MTLHTYMHNAGTDGLRMAIDVTSFSPKIWFFNKASTTVKLLCRYRDEMCV
jgi:hypothetical protein